MTTRNIALVEDDKTHAELLSQYIWEWAGEHYIHIDILVFFSAEQFLFSWEDNPCLDALFLDIQMPGMDGVELARKIREKNQELPIVFTTGITDYLQEGYEVAALHYLVKPLDKSKVAACMERICNKWEKEEKTRSFLLEAKEEKTGEKCQVRFTTKEIRYIEAVGHDTVVKVNASRYQVKKGIQRWQAELKGEPFVFCHRSFLVNLFYVSQTGRTEIVLDDGERVPLSRRKGKPFCEAFIRFYSRNGGIK